MSDATDQARTIRDRPAATLVERMSELLTAIGWARLMG
jgi:hypothetical protein